MAVPLKKLVRAAPPQFDPRRLPALAWGAFLGVLRSLFRVSTIAFIVVALALIVASYLYIDRPVATWLHRFEKSSVTGFFRAITELGSAAVMLALPFLAAAALGGAALLLRNSDRAAALWRAAGQSFFVFCCVALPAAIGLVAKIGIGRARPRIFFDGGVYGFTPLSFNYDWHSMPSGHSLAAAGFAAGLALIAPLPVFPIIAFFGAMIAFSRVTTTAHFFGDALAGGALAIVCAIVLKGAFRGMGSKKIFPTWDPNKKLRLRSISLSMKRR
ncbi:MAG: phosphatase PAP2 family protein [Alphaproteobacteria bacterium]